MIVVGGSYTESVLYPTPSSEFMGSGVRAALMLGGKVEAMITYATDDETELLADVLPFVPVLKSVERSTKVEFRYLDTALPPDILRLPSAAPEPLQCVYPESDVLAFGVAEQPMGYRITARRVVFDPQAPAHASAALLAKISADQIAVCANRREARRMTGYDSPTDAAMELLRQPHVEAVVVKCGALGYLTADHSGMAWHHAEPTLTVNALGSGDIFSSVFAREWFAGRPVAEAAAIASSAVATSADGTMLLAARRPLPLQAGYSPKVYLAGPFFTLSERWLVEQARAALTGLGARVFSPIHDVGPGDIEVAKKDLDGLDDCDVVFALLDGMDPGTIYETGWAARESIPIVGHSSEPHHKETKMLVGMGAEVHTDLTAALYRTIWAGQGLALTAGVYERAS